MGTLHPSNDTATNVSMTDSNFENALPSDVSLFAPQVDLTPKVETMDQEPYLLQPFEDTVMYNPFKQQKSDTLFGEVSADFDQSSVLDSFMTSILGEQPDNSGLDVTSLTDSLFVSAAKETQMSVFPVTHLYEFVYCFHQSSI